MGSFKVIMFYLFFTSFIVLIASFNGYNIGITQESYVQSQIINESSTNLNNLISLNGFKDFITGIYNLLNLNVSEYGIYGYVLNVILLFPLIIIAIFAIFKMLIGSD